MTQKRLREYWFIALLAGLDALAVFLVLDQITAYQSSLILIGWIAGFGFLFLNVIYLFLLALMFLFAPPHHLKEVYVNRFPKTALCYFIRNEKDGLFERMLYSFRNNQLPGVDFWILSDSDAAYEPSEFQLQVKLEATLGRKVFYRRRPEPFERKQGNLSEFLSSHPVYEYLYVCDADSMVPPRTVLKLLRKAQHPENEDIAIFQTLIKTAHAKTYYAKFEGLASESSQRLYFTTLFSLFRKSISFGHQHLVRAKQFKRIQLPKGLLSHDNWDTALLDELGLRVAFISDVTTYDETPSNYLESRRRESRWAQGTLQGIPLIYRKSISPIIRFLTFYGIYCYVMQPVFLFWLLLGLLSQSYLFGELISFKVNTVCLGQPANEMLCGILIFSLFVNYFHKAVLIRTFDDIKRFLYEITVATLIYAGNFVYTAFDILTLPLKKLIWQPMKKNPFEQITWTETIDALLPGTVIGLTGIWYLAQGTPFPHMAAVPIFTSLLFSIPLVYYSAKTMHRKRINTI